MADPICDAGPDEPSGSAGQRAYQGFKKAIIPAKVASKIPGIGPFLSTGVLAAGAAAGVLSAKTAPNLDLSPGCCPNCSAHLNRKRGLARDTFHCGNCQFGFEEVGTGYSVAKMVSNFTRDFAAAAKADSAERRRS
jgi:hypothetical protein